MSKRTEEGGYDSSAENSGRPDEPPQGEGTAVPPTFLAIEEHAKARRIPAPVFAAVRQMKGWSEGKKVLEAEFNGAVNAFLNAPVGGKE